METQANACVATATNNPVIAELFKKYEITPLTSLEGRYSYTEYQRLTSELTDLDILRTSLEIEYGMMGYPQTVEYEIVEAVVIVFEALHRAANPHRH